MDKIIILWVTLGAMFYFLGDFLFTPKSIKEKEPVWKRFYSELTFWEFVLKGPFSLIILYRVYKSQKNEE